MRVTGEPECYVCVSHSYSPRADLRRERWLFEMPANRLCGADIGSLIAIDSPSSRMMKLVAINYLTRTIFGMLDDEPQPLIVLVTDDGNWEMRQDHTIFLDAANTRGQTIRWPRDESETQWTTEKPA